MSTQDSAEMQFEVPVSLGDARDRREELNAQIREIEAQLSNKNREVDGSRVSAQEWHEWRRRATYAISKKRAEAVWLKNWIRDSTPQARDAVPDARHPAALVKQFNQGVGKLIQIYNQLEVFLEDPDNDQEFDKLEEAFEEARRLFYAD